MVRWVIDEARYLLQRRHKIDAEDLAAAPRYIARMLVSNAVYGELTREEMLQRYPTWRYGEEAVLDTSFLTETQDERRGISFEDVPNGITVDRPFVSKIAGDDSDPVFVGEEKPLPLTPDRQVIREIAKNNRSQINALFDQLMPTEWFPKYLKLRSGRYAEATHVDGDVLPLFQRKYPNYYHWIMDELPKLRALEQYPGDATVILASNPRPYVTESLDRLGIDYVQIDGSLTTADGVLVPINRNPKFVNISYVDNEYIEWLRRQVLDSFGGKSGKERIYINRQDAGDKQVENRRELMEELQKWGFESYTLSDQSFSENIELFQNAEIIVSPHGAGLTDIVFAENVEIIELSTLKAPPPAYFLLADQLGHGYRHITCTPLDDNQYDVQRNMRADVDDVVRTVRSLTE